MPSIVESGLRVSSSRDGVIEVYPVAGKYPLTSAISWVSASATSRHTLPPVPTFTIAEFATGAPTR